MNAKLFAVLSAHANGSLDVSAPHVRSTTCFRRHASAERSYTHTVTDISGAWDALRKRAGVQCRLHDLRHTAATKMAEAGVP